MQRKRLDPKDSFVDVKESNEVVFIDYETVRVALFHLFQNATKYTCPDTRIYIDFNRRDGFVEMTTNMISLEITDEDMIRLYDEEYSGINARAQKLNGEGLGMGILRRALELNSCRIEIRRDISEFNRKTINRVPYVNNEFVITFPRPR